MGFTPHPPPPPPPVVVGGGGGGWLKFPTEGSKGKEKKVTKKKKRGKLVKIKGFNFKFFKNFSNFGGLRPPNPRLSSLMNYFININSKLQIVPLCFFFLIFLL